LRLADTTDERVADESMAVYLFHRGEAITIHHANGDCLGRLDSQTTRILSLIAAMASLRFDALISVSRNRTASIEINIYGSLDDSDSIGDALSLNNVFLQAPSAFDTGYEYRNPQNFEIPDGQGASVEVGFSEPRELIKLKACDTYDTLERFLPTTNDESLLDEALESHRLQTPLMRHQKQALSFMLSREEPHFRNLSLNQEADSYGGILADEMGLGKTLTALALITRSIPDEESLAAPFEPVYTLVVVPSSALSSWQEQVEMHVCPGMLKSIVYHGPQRRSKFLDASWSGLVLTTYSTLVADSRLRDSPIYGKTWHRIVLDEAHFVKDRSTKRFKAVCALRSSRKWCLTGTPLQNRIEDICALLIFLRVISSELFNKEVMVPSRHGDDEGMYFLRSLLGAVMLRRTKALINLPLREDFRVELDLSQDERIIYEISRDESKPLLDNALTSFTHSNGVRVIQSLLRQRQVCNHGLELLPQAVQARFIRQREVRLWHKMPIEDKNPPIFCESCDTQMGLEEARPIFEFCFHQICPRCLAESPSASDSMEWCPLCTNPEESVKNAKSKAISFQAWSQNLNYQGPSTKVMKLIENLHSLPKTTANGKLSKRFATLAMHDTEC
jgi:SNF2 family DNA or RNA helicase